MTQEFREEKELFRTHKAMFRCYPFYFILCLVLIPFFGIGLLFLLFWWLNTRTTTLVVTDKRTILRKGILSRYTNEVLHQHVRNIQIIQSLSQRMMNVGTIGISSAAQADIEIRAVGIPMPDKVKALIDQYR